MKKILITGASGMIGGLILQHALQDDNVGDIIIFGRKLIRVDDPRVTEIVPKDFSNYENQGDAFSNVDAAFFCLGVYTGAVSNELFKTITVDYTTAFANKLKGKSPHATFVFLSGAGADLTEKSRVSFAKYKGIAENHLLRLQFNNLFIFRPGYIYPVQKRKEPNFFYRLYRFLYPVIKLLGTNASIKSTELAEAMYASMTIPANRDILENRDILLYLQSIGSRGIRT